MTRKWNIVNNQSNADYGVGNEFIYSTEILKSNLCDYNDAYILVTGDIAIIGHQETQITFKNWAPFTKCITKIDKTTIYQTANLDLVMAMYNLIEHHSNYSKTSEILWFYSNDEATNFNVDIANTNILNHSNIWVNY